MQVSATVPAGWVYIRVNDPGGDAYRLTRVVRNFDGAEVLVDENTWATHRTIRLTGQAPRREHRLHIFDRDSTGSYTIYYEAKPKYIVSTGEAKSKSDGEDVEIGSEMATAAVVSAVFDDCLYIESAQGIGHQGCWRLCPCG